MPLPAVLAYLRAFLLLLAAVPACHAAHNITAILAGHPDLAAFSHYLTATRLAADVNSGNTITVLAVGNAAMGPLSARGLPLAALRDVLSLHVLSDYYDAAKLHRLSGGSVLVSTLFQASGNAPGSSGIVNISMRAGGRVAFALHDEEDSPPTVFFVKSIKETPYNISVVQVSAVLSSPAAEALAAPREAVNITTAMSKKGCGRFAGLLLDADGAADTLQTCADGGLSLFCPSDKAVAAFLPKLKKLTADGRLALLLYHAVPIYYSLQALQSSNGDMNTLATDGAQSYGLTVRNDGDAVTLVSAAAKPARVTGTVIDSDPVAVYSIDAVLMPRELFNGSAPAAKHDSPPVLGPGASDGVAPSPVGDYDLPDDESNGAGAGAAGWRLAAAAGPAVVMVMWWA